MAKPTRPWITYAIVAFFIVAGINSMTNVVVGPASEMVGVINSSVHLPNEGVPEQIVNVQLKDGSLIQARVTSPNTAINGHTAYVRAYRRLLSDEQAYEVYRTESTKQFN